MRQLDDVPSLWLLDRIYEAAVDPEQWDPALHALAEWLDATTTAITVHHSDSHADAIFRAVRRDLKRVRDKKQCAADDICLRSAELHQPVGRVLTAAEAEASADLEGSAFYLDWVRPEGPYHHLRDVLRRDGDSMLYIALTRPSSAKPFGAEEAARLRAVLPHLERSVQLQRRLAVLQMERSMAQEALDLLPTGVLFVNHGGGILALNRRAEEVLRTADGLTARSSVLRAADVAQSTRLRHLIAHSVQTAAGAAAEGGGSLAVSRPSGRRSLQVLVLPLHSRCELLGHHRARAVVFVADPDIPLDQNEECLRQLYGLTRAEARLTTALMHAGSLEKAAPAAGITASTARGYLTRIYAKTGVARQAELVRLILVGPAQLRRMADAAPNLK